jgi:toxin YoeB
MSRNLTFTSTAWNEYMDWQKRDKKIANRINLLIKDIQRSPFEGLGKPEPLKENLSGYWSRQITEKHRIVYEVSKDNLKIIQVENHYDDK